MRTTTIILVLSTAATALVAGLFYAYSCSVNPGLGRLADRNYLEAMRSINRAILNPLFFASFLGALVLLPAATIINYSQSRECFVLLFAASVTYIVGAFGVTMFGNVPLNNMLDRFEVGDASAQALAEMRTKFEGSWNRLNDIRTFFSLAALVLAIIACIRYAAKQAA